MANTTTINNELNQTPQQDWYESRAPEHKDVSPQDYLTNYVAFRNYDAIEPALKPYNLNMNDYTWYNDPDNEGDFYYAELKQAAAEGDKEKIEEMVESHPTESANALPDNTKLNTEAEQAIDGGKDAEVDNDAVEDFIKQQQELIPHKSTVEANRERYEQDLYNDMLNQERAAEVDEDEMNGYGDISVYPEEDKPSMFRFKKGSHNSKKYKELIQSFNDYPSSQRNAALDILGNLNGQIDVDTLRNVNPWMDEGLAMIVSQLSEDNPVERYSKSSPFKSKLTETNKGILGPKSNSESSSIDWSKVRVYEPNEEPYLKVSDEYDWKNNPDYIPSEDSDVKPHKDEDFLGPDEYIDENGEIQVDPNWKPENADEDFFGPDEVDMGNDEFYDEPLHIRAKVDKYIDQLDKAEDKLVTEDEEFDTEKMDEAAEHIMHEVDEDETIPPEKKNEVKKEIKEAVLAKRNPINMNSLNLESSNEGIVKPDASKAGMQKGSSPSILGNVGSSALKSEQIKADKEKEAHVDLPRSSASMSTDVAYENGNNAVSMKNAAHQYGNEGAFARKGGLLGGRKKVGNISMGKGMPTDDSTSPRSSGVLKAPNVAEDMNALTLKDLIVKKSSKWPNRRLDKDGYLIVVRDGERVFINRQLLENFTRDNPRKIKDIRKIVQES